MTNEEWLNVRPEQSFSLVPVVARNVDVDYNFVIEYPKRIRSKDEVTMFFKRALS